MDLFNVKKRRTLDFKGFLKQAELAEKGKHDEKGEHEIAKEAMAGDVKGKEAQAVLDEPQTEKGKHDATKNTYEGPESGKAGYETKLDEPVTK